MKTNTPLFEHLLPEKTRAAEARSLLDTAAEAALAMSPAAPMPGTILQGALDRIQRREAGGKTGRRVILWSGWAAAAAACAALWLRHPQATAAPADGSAGEPGLPGMANGSHGAKSESGGGAESQGSPARIAPRGQFRTLRGISKHPDTDDADALRGELRRLSNSHQERFHAAPGLARMVVVEMTAPGAAEKHTTAPRLTPERVSDIMAAGLTGDRPPEAKPAGSSMDTPPMKLRPGSRPSEIILEKGLGPLGFLDLPEEVTLRHNDFPVNDWENAGLLRSPDGKFFDATGRILWEPGAGGQYIGRRVPEGFDAARFTTAPPQPGRAQVDAAAPVAYTLFDETTGAGSIVIADLPSAPQGQAYQLWLTDSMQQSPVSVGLLPELDGGSGRVFFDTLAPGFAPSGYYLTLEPASGSAQPGGTKVLSGPQIPAK